jgi:preprotein translocase subunit SecE
LLILKDTYNELVNKVTWPSWEELQESAVVVMIASFIIALVIAVMDISFKNYGRNLCIFLQRFH